MVRDKEASDQTTRIGINVESTGRFRTRDQAALHLKAEGRLAKLVARELTRNR